MKLIKILILIVLLLAGLLFFINYKIKLANNYIVGQIGEQRIFLQLADTPESQYRGLSNQKSLCPDCGLLFVFPKIEKQTFVMRQMNFPLDIIWLSNNQIVGVSENLPPEKNPPYTPYKSPQKVNAVLEVNANYFKTKKLKLNDQLTYDLNQ